MIAALVALMSVFLAVFLCALGRDAFERRRPMPAESPATWLERTLGRQVIVHTTDDRSIEGILWLNLADGVVLRTAKLLEKPPVPMAGEVFVPRSQILLVQHQPA